MATEELLLVGCDVGGTHTDAVVIAAGSKRVIAAAKAATSTDVVSGVAEAVASAVAEAGSPPIRAIIIGTTALLNAVVTRSPDLARVFALRVGAPASAAIPPGSAWPGDLAATLGLSHWALLPGGVQFDGTALSAFDAAQVEVACAEAAARGYTAAAVTAVFSPVRSDDEDAAAAIARRYFAVVSARCARCHCRALCECSPVDAARPSAIP